MFPFLKKKQSVREPARTPKHTRIYAIGDIHGRLDLLVRLHDMIEQDASSAESAVRKVIVYVGDYVDRGLESKDVIDYFIYNKLDHFEQVFLKGNHEDAMLKFLENSNIGDIWLAWGGYATVQSYGVHLHDVHGRKREMEDIRMALVKAIPETHYDFMKNLKIQHIEGDYLFVHAGVKPGVELEKQSDEDMMMIRDEFIYSDYPDAEKTVVFGHTIFEEPFHKTGKISIDTGAYATGKLTAVVLEEESIRFLSTFS